MATPGPLPGFYHEFYIPIRKDHTSNFDPDAPEVEVLDRYEKVFVKECTANYLYLPKADPDFGKFKDNTGDNPKQTNAGRTYTKRAIKGSFQYTLQLIPDTEVIAFGKSKAFPDGGANPYLKNSISFSAQRTITVAEVLSWLANPDLLQNVWNLLPEEDSGAGYEEAKVLENYGKILALTTPNLITHRLRTVLDPVQVGEASKNPADIPEGEDGE